MKTYTVADLMEHFGVTQHTVLAWLASGELAGIDVSRQAGGRKRWRVSQQSLDEFILRRQSQPHPPKRRRKRSSGSDVIEFY